MILSVAFITFIVGYIVFSRNKTNPARLFIQNIPFAAFTHDILMKLSIGQKPNSKVERVPLEIPVNTIQPMNVGRLIHFRSFSSMWSLFLTGVLALIACVPVGLLGLKKEANHFCLLEFLCLFGVLRSAMMTSSNSGRNRLFALWFSISFGVLSYILLFCFSFNAFNIRPLIITMIDVPPSLLNFVISTVIGIIAYAMTFSVMKYYHVYHSIKTLNKDVAQWQLCQNAFREISGFKKDGIVYIHSTMPVMAIIFFGCRSFLSNYKYELYFDIAYIIIEVLIASFYLWIEKNNMKILLTEPYKYLSLFEQTRKFESGKNFHSSLNRSLELLPLYGIAFSAYPMVILLCSGIFGISFLMDGISKEISRIGSISMLVLMEIIMSSNKIASFFIY